ncbi:MAG TPA: IPT/TIG domain-containing protein [Cyclobacteriaceae bacterium]|nr:IPT/TIG domain-containing protein [Cyclobacteriaceae bacterium]
MSNTKIIRWISFLFFLFIVIQCREGEVATRFYPALDTKAVTDITIYGATLNAEVLNTGSDGVADHGFVFDDQPNPVLGNSDKITLGERSQSGIYSALANRNLIKEKNYYIRAYAITRSQNIVVYGQQVEFISMGCEAPEITNVIPDNGLITDTILVIGTFFSDVLANHKISFNSDSSRIIGLKKDSIICMVPVNTLAGENDIYLTLGQHTVKANKKFILHKAIISAVSPLFVTFGDSVSIAGYNFPKPRDLISALILEKDAEIISNSSHDLRVVISNEAAVPGSPVTLKIGAQTITSAEHIKLYLPVINNFTPLKGTRDTEIIINGNYFSPIIETSHVEMNGTSLAILESTPKYTRVKVPPGIRPGSYPISITVAGQTVLTQTDFEIIQPRITGINPPNGTWGNTITISGENFGPGIDDNIVTFSDVPATVIAASSTEIKVHVPNNLFDTVSTVSVLAIPIDSLIATFSFPFFLLPPSINSFTPLEGKGNTQVTISGENFNPIPDNQIVWFGDVKAEILSASSNALIVQLPACAIDTNVFIRIDIGGQNVISSETFRIIGVWRRVQNYPDTERAMAVAFAIGDYGYVTLGTQNIKTTEKKCWRYEPANDQWTEVAPFHFSNEGHTSAYQNQSSYVIDTNAYVGLGRIVQCCYREKIMRYSPTDNHWYQAASLGTGDETWAYESAVAYTLNGKGYVTTGYEHNSGNLSNKMWEYSPIDDSWSRKSDLPGVSRWEATGFSIGSKAYLIGGALCLYCSNDLSDDVWEYDASSDQWKQLNNFPGSKRYASAGFSINGKGYILGGAGEANAGHINRLNDMWEYDPITDTWTQLAYFPGESRAQAVVFVINGKAYYGTGHGIEGFFKDFWEFDPSKR